MLWKYRNWIDQNYSRKSECINNSKQAVDRMIKAFPELKEQHGTANGIEHYWCIDEGHNTVDPTSKKFECFVGQIPFRHTIIKYTTNNQLKLGDNYGI